MAKVFLDTNILIDLVEERKDINPELLDKEEIYISPLSIHILFYVLKKKVPFERLERITANFLQASFDEKIANQALTGPTNDFEDNVQLHSAAEAECDVFLTEDKKLLDMKFFGKVRIASSM